MALDANHKAADLEALFNEAAEVASYDSLETDENDDPVEPVEIEALFGRSLASEQDGNGVADRLVAWVRASDFATPPAKRRQILRGAEVWDIVGVELAGGLYRLNLVRNARPVPR